MHRYVAYGLTVASRLALPQLRRDADAGGEADLSFDHGSVDTISLAVADDRTSLHEEALCAWPPHIFLRMSRGKTCTHVTSPSVPDEVLQRYLVGPALGTLLHQRGLLTLHAGAVEVNGQACVFIGDKGAGKSTTVAALLASGHRLLADDIVAVELRSAKHGQPPLVRPAFPTMRLFPASAAAVGAPQSQLEPAGGRQGKVAWQVGDRFADAPVPLGGVFVLTPEDPIGAALLTGGAAVAPLIEHLYAPRFAGTDTITPQVLRAVAHVSQTVPVYRLARGEAFATLPQLVAAIERTIASGRGAATNLPADSKAA